jgi:hypothetical protein
MESRLRKGLFISLVTYMLTFLATAQITNNGSSEGGPLSVFSSLGDYIIEMLMIPASLDPGPIAMWIGGMAFTIYAFRLATESFDQKMGGWINNTGGVTNNSDKEYWIIASLLTLMFIGGTNFMGWVTDLVNLLIISAALLFFAIAIRVLWFGGSALGGSMMSVGHQARTGSLGNYARAAAERAQNRWGNGGQLDQVYDDYKNIPRCDVNDHLNPQNPGAGGGQPCWVDGCGGTW